MSIHTWHCTSGILIGEEETTRVRTPLWSQEILENSISVSTAPDIVQFWPMSREKWRGQYRKSYTSQCLVCRVAQLWPPRLFWTCCCTVDCTGDLSGRWPTRTDVYGLVLLDVPTHLAKNCWLLQASTYILVGYCTLLVCDLEVVLVTGLCRKKKLCML